MHTNDISRNTADATSRLLKGDITPDTAKGVAELARTEISNWRARMEYARHTGKVAKIEQLEERREKLAHAA
jgi:hypothetical protein